MSTEEWFLDNMAHWYPLCGHDDTKGLDIPQPTVLPPRQVRSCSASPKTLERSDKVGYRLMFWVRIPNTL